MKKLFLLIFLFSFYNTNAQDINWYVKNNVLESPYSNSQIVSSLDHFNIKKVSHPNEVGPARNDIFIIFEDGKHFNSRYLSDSYWNDNPSTTIDSNYHLNTTRGIKHLYFTNVYEGDEEPDAFVEPIEPGVSMNFHRLNVLGDFMLDYNLTIPPRTITSNHTPVAGKDLTLIINHDSLNKGCTYDLCLDTVFFQSRFSEFNIRGSNIFGSFGLTEFVASGERARGTRPTSLVPQQEVLDFNCIKDITFGGDYHYTYVNYYIPEDPDSIFSNVPLHFSITPQNMTCNPSYSFRDTIKDSHDPNYIQVLRVTKPNNSEWSTIKYRAQCMNDGAAEQPNPSIEFTFPFPISLDKIKITSSSIRNHDPFPTLFNKRAPLLSSPYNNRIKFDFEGTLDFCPIPTEREECIAWVEFCIKVDSSDVNVLLDSLRPFHRNTNFGLDVYPIERFVDLPFDTCKDEIIIEAPSEEETEGELIGSFDFKHSYQRFDSVPEPISEIASITYCRKNKICDCPSNTSKCFWYSIVCNNNIKWTKVFCLVIFLYLLLLLAIIYRRSKV